jgi:HJR/Mrr/RecB family endonuclease
MARTLNDAISANAERMGPVDAVLVDVHLDMSSSFIGTSRQISADILTSLRARFGKAKIIAYTSFADSLGELKENADKLFVKLMSKRDAELHVRELVEFIVGAPNASKFSDVEIGDLESALKEGSLRILSPVTEENRVIEMNDKKFKIFVEISNVVTDQLMRRIAKDPNFMQQVPPDVFEEICATVLARDGFEVHVTNKSKDGGYDVMAVRKFGYGAALFLVECKRYSLQNPVGVEIIRQLNGVIEASNASGGFVMTSSRFTRGALEFSEQAKFRMNLVDAVKLNKWVGKVLPS